ncbi:hypothetical protein EUGRSUZ_E00007 [Eucalyptus grandis]|uniref:Uncharacterized protein n=2 Tax=Eucalyptus grandis TaxID=71139 RepID=A0ACC3KR26_EUCGR|nr:hypothetical protein EUGRSUZ_E00007 [Eucalyptus grandis]
MSRLLSYGCASGRIRELQVLTGTGIEDLTEALLSKISLFSRVFSLKLSICRPPRFLQGGVMLSLQCSQLWLPDKINS